MVVNFNTEHQRQTSDGSADYDGCNHQCLGIGVNIDGRSRLADNGRYRIWRMDQLEKEQ